MSTMHMQGVGEVAAKPLSEAVIGDRLMWNYGAVETVVSLERVTPKTIILVTRSKDGGECSRKKRGTTSVCILPRRDVR